MQSRNNATPSKPHSPAYALAQHGLHMPHSREPLCFTASATGVIAAMLYRIALGWLSLCAGVLLAGCASIPHTQPGAPLRVMTFNIRTPVASDGINRWEARKGLIAQMVAGAHPDVFGTQELHQEQGDDIVRRLPQYAWFGLDRRGRHTDEHMGVFYRKDLFRVVDSGNFWLSDHPEQPGSMGWGDPFPRMVTWALFERIDDGARFYLYDTHFPYREQDDDARERSARLIASRLSLLPADVPIVLTGDFNTGPDSGTHAALTSGLLEDAWLTAPRREGPDKTFHNFTGVPDQRIDWILYRGLQVRSVQTITLHDGKRYPSDHFPVVAEFVLPSP